MAWDVDWSHGTEHMWDEHGVTVAEAWEAILDPDALLLDPDPKSRSGTSARLIGFAPSILSVLVVILVHRDDRPGGWWGANGWRANAADRRFYQDGGMA